VKQRVDSSLREVGVLAPIECGVEERVWVAARLPTSTQIINQGVYTGGSQVGILLQIPSGIEERVRITSFQSAMR
jgi:hypothetical protein